MNTTSERTDLAVIGVVGAGTMGRGIVHVSAAQGLRVILVDNSPEALESSRTQLADEYTRLQSTGTITQLERDARKNALATSTDMEVLRECDVIIEAVPEQLELKLRVIAGIESNARENAVIASNTSSIPITRLSRALAKPSRFLGIHFFNPVPRMPLVEIIHTTMTDERTTRVMESFVRTQLGKEPIVVSDRPGFVVNALLIPFLISAIRMVDSGYSNARDVDDGMRLGAGHPMGPLTLSDLIGLDTICHVADALHSETRDPALVVPNNLRRMVEAGRLGKKSGKGFYDYTTEGSQPGPAALAPAETS